MVQKRSDLLLLLTSTLTALLTTRQPRSDPDKSSALAVLSERFFKDPMNSARSSIACTAKKVRSFSGRTVRCMSSSDPASEGPPRGTYEAVLANEEYGLDKLNKYSAVITQRKSQGAGQAQLYATDVGKIAGGMAKPQVGISSIWYEGNPCNMHLLDLAGILKDQVQDAGMVGLRFNSIGVSDGISNGTDGMAYSLQSRDLIADGIETVMGAQFYDANLSVPGCDKNMPGVVMAMARVNRPSVMVYGGTIRAGCRPEMEEKLDIISAFQAYGEYITDQIDDETRESIVQSSCPGPGACGGMYTANTMASAIEALGMSVPYSSSIPAWDPALNGGSGGLHAEKIDECARAVEALQHCMKNDIK